MPEGKDCGEVAQCSHAVMLEYLEGWKTMNRLRETRWRCRFGVKLEVILET